MGFQISYGNDPVITYRKSEEKPMQFRKSRLLKCVCVCFFALLFVCCLIPQVRGWLVHLLLPGDSELTARALENMVFAIEEGIPVREAMVSFCKEIIGGAA